MVILAAKNLFCSFQQSLDCCTGNTLLKEDTASHDQQRNQFGFLNLFCQFKATPFTQHLEKFHQHRIHQI